jgi:hypothetical protein
MKEHDTQQAVLEAALDRVDTTHMQHHQALNVAINRVEATHNEPGGGGRPPPEAAVAPQTRKTTMPATTSCSLRTNSSFLSSTAPVILIRG